MPLIGVGRRGGRCSSSLGIFGCPCRSSGFPLPVRDRHGSLECLEYLDWSLAAIKVRFSPLLTGGIPEWRAVGASLVGLSARLHDASSPASSGSAMSFHFYLIVLACVTRTANRPGAIFIAPVLTTVRRSRLALSLILFVTLAALMASSLSGTANAYRQSLAGVQAGTAVVRRSFKRANECC